jgi:hypothetical protein
MHVERNAGDWRTVRGRGEHTVSEVIGLGLRNYPIGRRFRETRRLSRQGQSNPSVNGGFRTCYDGPTMQRTAPAGYDSDFTLWAEEQAVALREGRFADLDMPHLLEEIDDLSNRKRDELLSRLTRLSMHLLKLQHQPERTSGSWRGTIVEQATRIRRVLKGSPSLRPEMPAFIAEAYVDARPQAAAETEIAIAIAIANFPEAATPEFERALQAALAGEDFGF